MVEEPSEEEFLVFSFEGGRGTFWRMVQIFISEEFLVFSFEGGRGTFWRMVQIFISEEFLVFKVAEEPFGEEILDL